MISLVFLVSGDGGTLKFINEIIKTKHIQNVSIECVIADRECGALSYSKTEGLPNNLIKYDKEHSAELLKSLENISPDFIITTFHKILDQNIVSKYRNKLINLHYSLLPSFKGLIGMQTLKEAIKLKSRFIGGTCHYIDEKVDNGEIISQFAFHVNYPNNLSTLQNIEFRASCILLLNSLLLLKNTTINNLPLSSISILASKIYFEPPLSINTEYLTEEFWKKIRL